jgi:hypothetical protein
MVTRAQDTHALPDPHAPMSRTPVRRPPDMARGQEGRVTVDLTGRPAGLSTVDALARLLLVARRAGRGVEIRCGPRLRELLDLTGLLVELQGQSEPREEHCGVEEVMDMHDPTA